MENIATNDISLIIPTVDKKHISVIRNAIKAQTVKPKEILIIEDKLRKGASWARNQGIAKSKCKMVAFLDDDCIPPDDWLEKLVEAINKNNAHVAGGIYIETDPFLKELREMRGPYPAKTEIDKIGNVAMAGNIMFTKEILNQCYKKHGYYFNESVKGGEDFELAWRLRKLGALFIFVPNSPKHLKKISFKGYLNLMFGRGKGLATMSKLIKYGNVVPFEKSMLWDSQGQKKNHLKAFVHYFIGPFNIGDFSKIKYFIFFWLGQKFKAIGYLKNRYFAVN